MDLSPSTQRRIAEGSRRARVGELLRSYPAIDAGETAEILRFLKKGPPLEAALLTTDDQLRDKLRQFRKDHSRHFALGLREYLIVAILVLALAAGLALLWDSGLGG